MSEVFQLFECGDIFQFTDPADSYATWQGLRGPKGDPGEPGPPGQGLTISGTVATVADLPASAVQGTVYNVGSEAPYELYMYEVGTGWISLGYLEGPEGPAGAAAGFGTPTISVGSGTGTPSASVTASGPDTAKVFAFAFTNLKGAQGAPGQDGADGADGVSPEVTIGTITGGHSVTITDVDHPTGQTFDVMDGEDGQDGAPGAPGAAATIAVGSVSGLPAGSTPTVTNSGSSSAAVFDFGIPAGAQGAPGQDGDDGAAAGFGTPTVSVGSGTGTPTASVTASGPDTAKVFAFSFDNLKGATGATGQGVPAGGSAGQVLTKKTSGTDYDTEWATPEAGGGALYFPSVAMSATTGTIISISDPAITADYVLASVVFSKPAAVTAGGNFSSGAGTFTMTGTCTDATCTAQITLVKKSN